MANRFFCRRGLIGLVCLLALSDCASEASPPYVIGGPQCVLGDKSGYYRFLGLEFDFLNTESRAVSALEVSFMVYDQETGKNPLIGSNALRMRFSGAIEPGETKRLIASLDSYLYQVPSEPFLIDHFFVARIEYADGGVWTDPLGTYHVTAN